MPVMLADALPPYAHYGIKSSASVFFPRRSNMRMWCNGNTTAFQAVDAGSIPAIRSKGAFT